MAIHLVTVKFSNGSHITNTVKGKRASSTADYRSAVQALAHKLFPDRAASIREVKRSTVGGLQLWEIEA